MNIAVDSQNKENKKGEQKTSLLIIQIVVKYDFAGMPGNRIQQCSITTFNGFEGRGGHQPLNHSQ